MSEAWKIADLDLSILLWRFTDTLFQPVQDSNKCNSRHRQDMMKIRVDIHAMSSTASSHLALSEKFIDCLTGVDERIAKVEQMLHIQSQQLQANQFMQVRAAYSSKPRILQLRYLNTRPLDEALLKFYSLALASDLKSWSRPDYHWSMCSLFAIAPSDPRQAAMQDAEQPPEIPLMGTLTKLSDLREEYIRGNQTFVKQINWLVQQGFLGVRRTRGDGDLRLTLFVTTRR